MTGFDQITLVFTVAVGAIVSSVGLFPRNEMLRRSVVPIFAFAGFAAGCCMLGYIVALNDVRSTISGLSAQVALLDVPFVYFIGGALAGLFGGSYLLRTILPPEAFTEMPDEESDTDAPADHKSDQVVKPTRLRRQRSTVVKAVTKKERKTDSDTSNDSLRPGGE